MGEPKYNYEQQEQVTGRNHSRSIAFEQPGLNTGGLKPVLRDLNLALSFCHGSKHIVVRVVF